MRDLELLIPTLFGLEGLCADELRRLGLSDVRAENGRVLCAARPADIPRVNLNLRTGERVLLLQAEEGRVRGKGEDRDWRAAEAGAVFGGELSVEFDRNLHE